MVFSGMTRITCILSVVDGLVRCGTNLRDHHVILQGLTQDGVKAERRLFQRYLDRVRLADRFGQSQ